MVESVPCRRPAIADPHATEGMAVQFVCPNPACGAALVFAEPPRGPEARCPQCGQSLTPVAAAVPPSLHNPNDAPALADGSSFGRYTIIRRLGQGGMASVYLAHDPSLDRRIALKIPAITPNDGPDALQRFYREARAAAALEHPNLCPVYDVGQLDGTPYLTMAFIDGKPLSDLIGRGTPWPQRQVAAVVRKLALALHEAHEQGVVHRDLKPANILVNRKRELVIVDFGLAQRTGDTNVRLTRTGVILGTPSYMSPEQVAGDVRAMGPGCDIYALGVILYELLTDKLPFEGPVALVLGQILAAEPDPPSRFRPDVDPALERICLKAMAKRVADRYNLMTELAEELARYLNQAASSSVVVPTADPGGAHSGPRAGTGTLVGRLLEYVAPQSSPSGAPPGRDGLESAATPSSRFRRPQIAWAAVATVLLLGALIFLARPGRETQGNPDQTAVTRANAAATTPPATGEKPPRPTVAAGTARAATVPNPSSALAPWLFHYDDRFAQARNALLTEKDFKKADEILDTCPPDLRGWEWHYCKLVCARRLRGTVSQDAPGRAALSPADEWLPTVTISAGGTGGIAFSPDSSQVAIKYGGGPAGAHLLIASLSTAQVQRRLRVSDRMVAAVGYSPDGKWIATGDADGAVRVWDAASLVLHRRFEGHVKNKYNDEGVIQSVAFSPDSSRIASSGDDGTVRVWSIENGDSIGVFFHPDTRFVWKVVWGPEGNWLMSATDVYIKQWDVQSGRAMRELSPSGARDIALSPDGRRLAATAGLRIVAVEGKDVVLTFDDSRAASFVVFTPDGRRLVTGHAGHADVWDAVTSRWLLRIGPKDEDAFGLVAISPDGQTIARAANDGAKVWSLKEVPAGTRAEQTDAPNAAKPSADQARTPAPADPPQAATERSRRRAYADTMVQVQQLLDKQDFQGADPLLAACPADLRGWEWHYCRRVCDLGGRNDAGSRISRGIKLGWVTNAAFSPDGARVACCLNRTDPGTATKCWLLSIDVSTGMTRGQVEVYKDKPNKAKTLGLAYSPDGKTVATGSWDGMVRTWAWDAKTLAKRGAQRISITAGSPRASQIECVSYSPDGRWLAVTCHDGRMRLWSGDGAGLPGTGQPAAESGASPARKAAASGAAPRGKAGAIDGDPARTLLVGQDDVPWNVIWGPRGRWLATSGPTIKVRSLPSGQELFALGGPSRKLALSPDGGRVASVGNGSEIAVWDVATRQRVGTWSGKETYNHVAFSPDGTRLATVGRWNVELWDAEAGTRLLELTEPRDESSYNAASLWVGFSPDGRRLAAAGPGGSRLWSIDAPATRP